MNLCISQATTMPAAFADDVAGTADGGCRHVEVWLTKLERHVAEHGADSAAAVLAAKGVVPVAAAFQGGLLLSHGEQRAAHVDHFRRRLDLCQRFAIPTLIVAADPAPRSDPSALGRAVAALADAARWAAGFGVTLALEFQAGGVISCLDTAVSVVEACGEGNVGVCLDVFHFTKGPSKADDLLRLTAANLAHVQVCDVAGVPREVMADADRVFPGEGDVRLAAVVDRLRAIGYDKWVSLELMNPELWRAKVSQVAELGMTSLQRLV